MNSFDQASFDALSIFDQAPTRGPVRRARRTRLRPTWVAVASAGIVGTIGGVLIAVLSGPVIW